MLVKYGICMGDKNCNHLVTNKAKIMDKINHVYRHISKYIALGFRHVRIPNLLPNGYTDIEIEELCASLSSSNYYGNFSVLDCTFSMHLPYSRTVSTREDVDSFCKYIHNTLKLVDAVGLRGLIINCHIGCSFFQEQSVCNLIRRGLTRAELNRIVFENDERVKNCDSILRVSSLLDCGIVFDNLHNRLLPSAGDLENFAYRASQMSYVHSQGCKVHYSNGDSKGHWSFINLPDLLEVLELYSGYVSELTVMVELNQSLAAIEELKYITYNKFEWVKGYSMVYEPI